MTRLLLLTTLILLCAFAPVDAQDTHYWNQQYGTRSTLLGGAVIGSVADLGATFYNPGMVALRENPEFVLSARVYQYSSLTLADGAGEGLDITTSSIKPAPSLVAGSFTFGWLGDHKLAYSVLTRQRMDLGLVARAGGQQDVIPSVPGDEFFGAEFVGEQDMSDLWAGITWAHGLGEKMAIGVTTYGAIRGQESRRQFIGEALDTTGNIAVVIDIVDYEYKNYRVLWKLGWGMELDRLTLGATVTTPSISVGGSGKALVNTAIVGFDSIPSFLASSYQEGVSAEFKSPAAFGAGFSYQFGRYKVHVSAEYYAKVDEYTVLEIDSVVATDGRKSAAVLMESLNDVLNWGVGLEYATRGRWSAYGSFVTDFSAATENSRVKHDISSWDIYHVAGGGVVRFNRTEITVGATYAFGDNDAIINLNLDEANEDNGLRGGTSRTAVDYRAFKLIFGFSVDL
jgi:hypothetical protein